MNVGTVFAPIIDWLRGTGSWKPLTGLLGICVVVLWAPDPIRGLLRIDGLPGWAFPAAGLAFIFLAILLALELFLECRTLRRDWARKRKEIREQEKCLHRLRQDEKECVLRCLDNEAQITFFKSDEGAVERLRKRNILQSEGDSEDDGYPFSLLPWVEHYYKSHPEARKQIENDVQQAGSPTSHA